MSKKVKKDNPKKQATKSRIEKTVDATKTLLAAAEKGEKVTGAIRKFVLPVALLAFVTWAYSSLEVDPRKD